MTSDVEAQVSAVAEDWGNVSPDAQAAAAGFLEAFGSAPAGVWSAPGRVNLIGEHTDYNDGFALPFALNRRTYAAISLREDALARCVSADFGSAEVDVSTVSPQSPPDGWAAYAVGVAWAMAEHVGQVGADIQGFDLFIHSTVPGGAGVSSSAALECSVAVALNELTGAGLDRRTLAAIGRRAENDMAGAPTGVMDQLASLFGEAGHALLLDCRSLDVTSKKFDPMVSGLELIVINTNVKHALVSGEYAERRQSCEESADLLGVTALRDATLAQLNERADVVGPTRLRRARHVISENSRVHAVVDALGLGDLNAVGQLLSASHASLRDDFEVSCPELDSVCESAEAAGSVGARMTGGGFGGSAIALVPITQSDEIQSKILLAARERGYPQPSILPAVPSVSAGRDL